MEKICKHAQTGSGRCNHAATAFLYNENHALDAWFKKAYGGE